MKRLVDRVAIITGSSSGIGQAIAKRLAEEGASILVNYADHLEGAQETKRLVEAAGTKGVIGQADVSILQQVTTLVALAYSSFGRVDILVNNAGMEKKSDFIDVSEEDYEKVLGVNLKGPFFLTQAVVRRWRDDHVAGRVINISSVHEDIAFPGFSSYCASKGGLRMLMRNLAVELGPLGITVNNIAPGAISTPINASLLNDQPKLDALLKNIPLGRLGSPEDVSGLVAYLASYEAAYVNGATFVIDGGLSKSYHEQ